MGFSSVPAASTAVNKPITTGLMSLYRTNDDSFNDGTGIGDGIIIDRHLLNARWNFASFELLALTPLPSNWYLYAGTNALSTVGNRQGLAPTAASSGKLAENFLYRPNSARTLVIDFEISIDGTTATAKSIGLQSGANFYVVMGFTSGVANQIFCGSYSDAGIGTGTTNQIAYTYSANTIYRMRIKLISNTSVEYYVSADNGVTWTLLTTYTTNIPSTLWLQPYMWNNAGTGTLTMYSYRRGML